MKKKIILFLFLLPFVGYTQQIVKPTAITQTAGNSESTFGLSLDNLITGSGLSAEPATVGDLANSTHAVAWADSWATKDEGTPNYFGDVANYPDVVLELDLGSKFQLTSFVYWGYPLFHVNNPKNITLEFSSDGGTTYSATENISLASSVDGGSGIVHQSASWTTAKLANYVKLTITDNHGGGRIGFGELRFGGTPEAGLPANPSNLNVSATSSTELAVNWNDNSSDETGFKIERKEGNNPFSLITTTAANITTFNDTGLNPYTIYSYRVTATNSMGNSIGNTEGSGATNAVNGRPTILITPTSITQNQGDTEGCCGLSANDMIDNSGLSASPTISNIVNIVHTGGFAEGNSFATATDQAGGYFSASNPDPRFTLNLGNSYNLSSLVIWGYPLDGSAEAKGFKLEFSSDGGTTYSNGTENIVSAISLGGNSNAAILTFSQVRTADFVRISFTDNHGGGRAALGEVKFVGALKSPLSLESDLVSKIKLYPNPTEDYLYISDIETQSVASLINIFGKKIKTFKLIEKIEKIDLRDLSTGIYFISVDIAEKRFIKKIIKN